MAADQAPPPRYDVAERYGPLVHRSVHHASLLLLAGSLIFVVGMVVTQVGYGSSYSLRDNYISDLGAVHCGTVNGTGAFGSGGHYVCSPWYLVFDVSLVVLGVCLVLAVLLLRTAFPARRTRSLGLLLLALTGIGTAGVGVFPEDVNINAHVASAITAFVCGGLALVVLGIAMFRDTRWDGFRAYSILSGFVSLAAIVLFVTKTYLYLGVGGMERLIVAPITLWAIVVGVHLMRIPTYAPRVLPKSTGE